ncbi:MAG: hypothetical protein ACYCW6_13700 [Candidatus Xenobia bacterium]
MRWVWAVLVICLFAPTWAADDAHLVRGGVSVGPYRLGSDFSASRKALGKPDRTQESQIPPYDTHLFWYEKQGLAFFVKGSTLNGITVISTDYHTPEGIRVGSSRAQVEHVYGPPAKLRQRDVTYPELGLAFTYDSSGHVQRLFVVDKEARDALKGDRQIVAGQRLGGIRLGGSVADVVAQWGKPTRTAQLPSSPDHTLLQFEDQGIILVMYNGRIDGVTTVSGEYTTPNGLHVGVSRADVYKIYGSHPVNADGIDAYKSKGIGFTFEGDKVTEITILPVH